MTPAFRTLFYAVEGQYMCMWVQRIIRTTDMQQLGLVEDGDAVDGSEIRRSPVDIRESTIINRVLYIPGGAGFLPSTVCFRNFG